MVDRFNVTVEGLIGSQNVKKSCESYTIDYSGLQALLKVLKRGNGRITSIEKLDVDRTPNYSAVVTPMMVELQPFANEDELQVWKKALNNVMPQVEVRSRRIGGSTFQIPTELPANRKISIGMKWMIKYARARSGKGMAEKLAAEVMAAAKGEGNSVKKREDVHKMAEANRAFAHFKAR